MWKYFSMIRRPSAAEMAHAEILPWQAGAMAHEPASLPGLGGMRASALRLSLR
jgi:hypothetical protein